MNAGDNVYDQEDFGFTGSYYNISPTVIDDYTKQKLLKFMRNIDNNDKQTGERY